jgi:hypothetical protein
MMVMHAEAVEILVKKARFTPEVAVGIAEAMGVSMSMAQLVTVPILDARLHEVRSDSKALGVDLRAETKTLGTELRAETKTLGTELRAEMHTLGTELRGEMHTLGTELRAEMKTLGTELRAEMKTLGAQVNAAMEQTKAELVRWVFLTMLGNVTLGAFASQVFKLFSN